MTYTVTWYRYPHGDESEEMESNWREFTSFEKALKFLEGRVRIIKSTHWGGGYIEDSNFNTLYDIDYEGNPEDLRETGKWRAEEINGKGGESMKIEINGTTKEIADLVVALQSQQTNEMTAPMISMDGAKLDASISRQIQRVFEEARS